MPGSRSSRRKRGLLRRTGIVFPAAGVAAVAIAAVTVAAYLHSPSGNGASSLAQAIDALPKSSSIALLEAERQQLIVMNTASKTLSVAAKPKMVSPSQVMASESAAAESSGASSSSTSTGGDSTVSAPPPDPGTAQSIAYNMLPSFGFSQSSQWGCLLNLWNRESSWIYDAENPSGAYGIPQALPASKMASAGSDYLTNPTTQIKWGLGYITQVYGTPCDAWSHEETDGWY
jgi:transglycosylase-like protein with SLT domain